MASKLFLLTTVELDPVTTCLSKWSKKLEEEAERQRFDVVNLHQENATRKNLESRIESRKPSLLVFNGHGLSDRIQGFNEPLLIAGENEGVTNGLLVYARTCSCVSKLGESCVKQGVKAFVGYLGLFFIPLDGLKAAHPFEDELSAPIMRTSNLIVEVLLKGNSVRDAIERSNQHAEKEIEYVKSSNFHDARLAPIVIGCLKLNQKALKALGDANAKVS